MSGQMVSARERGVRGGAQIGRPALPSCRRCVSYAREIPCGSARAQPSPRRDAPSPLAFAKSCKGGDVSVLDPALAWDVRCIYLFTHTHTWGLGGCSTPHLSRSLGERRRGRKRANPKVRYALPASPPPGGATYSSCPSPCAPCALSRRAPPPVGRSASRAQSRSPTPTW